MRITHEVKNYNVHNVEFIESYHVDAYHYVSIDIFVEFYINAQKINLVIRTGDTNHFDIFGLQTNDLAIYTAEPEESTAITEGYAALIKAVDSDNTIIDKGYKKAIKKELSSMYKTADKVVAGYLKERLS